MKFDVTSNVMQVNSTIRKLHRDQMPFATARAINKAMLDSQKAQRKGMHERFTIRRPSFTNQAVKIRPFATKHELFGIMRIESPGGLARADIFTKFEDGGMKQPRGERLAVPKEVRRTKAGVIPRNMRPKALKGGLVLSRKGMKVHARSARAEVLLGKYNTILIRRAAGRGLILQRKGRGKASTLVVLYTYAPQVRIAPDLKFEETISQTVERTIATHLDRELARAIRTSR